MYPGTWQILIIVLLLVLLFGRGKISELMGDVAKGIKSFKKGMSDDEATAEKKNEPKVIDNDPQATTASRTETESRKVG